MRCFRFIIFGSFRPLASCCDRWFSPKASSGLAACLFCVAFALFCGTETGQPAKDRKSTRLNSSHVKISYAVFCLKKKKKTNTKKNKKQQQNNIKEKNNQ